jgi:hypothetical protein
MLELYAPNYHLNLSSNKMRCCHISAIMLRIAWTERWLGDGSAEVDQLLGLLGHQIYVKNIVYQVKNNDHQHLKAHIQDAVATVTSSMRQGTWNEVKYHLDICHASRGAHIEIY